MSDDTGKEAEKAIQWIAAEYKYLLKLKEQIDKIGAEENTAKEARSLRKAKRAFKLLSRCEAKAEQHVERLKERIKQNPELATVGGQIDISEKQLVKAFSFYTGAFKESLEKLIKAIDEKNVFRLFPSKHKEDISSAEKKINSIAQAIDKHIAVLVPWVQALQADLERSKTEMRRKFLKGTAATIATPTVAKAAGFLGGFFSFMHHLSAQTYLRIRYIKIYETVALALPVRRGMGYAHVAKYVTGNESNYPEIKRFNRNKILKVGATIYVPKKLVSEELKIILDENKFDKFTIDAEEASSLAAIMETNCNTKRFGYNETLYLLLVINDDINLANPVMFDGQPIIIPESLLHPELIREDEKPAPDKVEREQVPKPREKPRKRPTTSDDKLIARMSTYQNPYRLSESRVWRTVRARDRFGARRVRSGGRISARGHTGLDLPATVGTRLFPIGVGRVTEIKDYERPRSTYWRNGKVIEVKTAFGYRVKYLHMKKFRRGLKVGDPVDLDTVIGYVGITGNASASNPHVHIQIKDPNGRIIDPQVFVRPSNSLEGVAELQASIRRNRNLYLELFRDVDRNAF